MSYSAGHVHFDVMSGLFPLVGSIAGGWLRFKTRSLLIPVLGHGIANAAFHIAGGLSSEHSQQGENRPMCWLPHISACFRE
jgi:uncharacterized protein